MRQRGVIQLRLECLPSGPIQLCVRYYHVVQPNLSSWAPRILRKLFGKISNLAGRQRNYHWRSEERPISRHAGWWCHHCFESLDSSPYLTGGDVQPDYNQNGLEDYISYQLARPLFCARASRSERRWMRGKIQVRTKNVSRNLWVWRRHLSRRAGSVRTWFMWPRGTAILIEQFATVAADIAVQRDEQSRIDSAAVRGKNPSTSTLQQLENHHNGLSNGRGAGAATEEVHRINRRNNTSSENVSRNTKLRCYRCGEGHHSRQCPKDWKNF